MLKKMRWRFIQAAMAAFTAVILALLCVINVVNYTNVTQQQDDTLQNLLDARNPPEKRDRPGQDDALRHFSPEVRFMMRFFTVTCDADGRVTSVNQDNIASITQEDAEAFAAQVLKGGRPHGYYQGYRYLVVQTGEGAQLIFLNSERELQSMKGLLNHTLLTAIVALAAVFVLILAFSSRAIAPYMRNMETQKQFITNASHELKTPLTAIATSADVLALENENTEWVHTIQQQCLKLSRLIGDLVTLSRLDEENPFPEKAPFSLSDAAWEISEPFASLAKARGKTYACQIQDGVTLTGDKAAVQQMISILLDNAVKYSDEGGAISLTVQRKGKKALMEVYSTCAHPPADLDRLFDRFYRGDASHSGAKAGNGIGLSIAKATAQAHGGDLTVQSRDGGIVFQARF